MRYARAFPVPFVYCSRHEAWRDTSIGARSRFRACRQAAPTLSFEVVPEADGMWLTPRTGGRCAWSSCTDAAGAYTDYFLPVAVTRRASTALAVRQAAATRNEGRACCQVRRNMC